MNTSSGQADVMFYYVTDDNEKPIGPVSLEQLRALAAEGKINGNTLVIVEGANEWERFSDVEIRHHVGARGGGGHGSGGRGKRDWSSFLDRFLQFNFRFGKIVAAVLAAIFLLGMFGGLFVLLMNSAAQVQVPTFEDIGPKGQSIKASGADYSDLDERRAADKMFGDKISSLVKTYHLTTDSYGQILAVVSQLPRSHQKEYVRGLEDALAKGKAFAEKNPSEQSLTSQQIVDRYPEAFGDAIARAAQQRAQAAITRLTALGIAAACCLAAFIMIAIPAVLMIEQNTRRILDGLGQSA
jgi:hypothetical protein